MLLLDKNDGKVGGLLILLQYAVGVDASGTSRAPPHFAGSRASPNFPSNTMLSNDVLNAAEMQTASTEVAVVTSQGWAHPVSHSPFAR